MRRPPVPAAALAQCLMLHVAIVSAQKMMARMATYADWAPAGLVETADLIDQASDLLAAIIANGGAQ